MPMHSRRDPVRAHSAGRLWRNATAVASVLILGCGSPQQREATAGAALEGAGKGAATGALVGAGAGLRLSIYCGPYIVACAPVFAAYGGAAGLVAGGVGGAVVGAVKAPQVPGPITQDPTPAPTAAPAQSLAGLTLIPPNSVADQMPAGFLYVDARSVRRADGTDRFAIVTIDLERPTERGEKSYLAEIQTHCERGALTLNWWSTFSEAGSKGFAIKSHPVSPPIVVETPSAPLANVIASICQHPI